jgi:hypothetical protein
MSATVTLARDEPAIDPAGIAPDDVVEFVHNLAESDEFRAELERDPRAVLGRFGLRVADDQIPLSVTLPPKEVIRDAADQITLGRQFRPEMVAFHLLIAFFLFLFFLARPKRKA